LVLRYEVNSLEYGKPCNLFTLYVGIGGCQRVEDRWLVIK
jgi:hypothetical protein